MVQSLWEIKGRGSVSAETPDLASALFQPLSHIGSRFAQVLQQQHVIER